MEPDTLKLCELLVNRGAEYIELAKQWQAMADETYARLVKADDELAKLRAFRDAFSKWMDESDIAGSSLERAAWDALFKAYEVCR